MKKIFFTIATLTLSAGLFAQTQDSLLRRQMELQRDFNPTLLDADKISSLPALQEPTVTKANTNYSTWAGNIIPPAEIMLPRPGTIMTEIPFNQKRGYLSFNAGNYANLNGAMGYKLVKKEKHDLAFSFLHNSTNSEINYIQESDPVGNKAFFSDNLGELSYSHLADLLKLDMKLSYLYSAFNYYGNSFGESRFFENKNQRLGLLNGKVEIESKESDQVNYRGFIDFENFSTKFGPLFNNDPIKGNQINAMVGIDKPFRTITNKIGIDGWLFTTIYDNDLENYFLINAAPYLQFGGLNRTARLGADILFQNADNLRVRVVPNLKLHLGVTDRTSLYADIHGGFQNNTFPDLMNESRYILPAKSVKPSFSLIEIDGGVKIGEIDGFRFDFFGGYRKTENEHFLLLGSGKSAGESLDNSTNIETLRAIYGTLAHSHVGGTVHTNIWTPLDILLRLKKNFYNAAEIKNNGVEITDPKAYNLPGIELDISATVDIIENLKFNLNYHLATDRLSYFSDENIKMDNINDLNIAALYRINDSFSLKLNANNILSQKYDIWYGYPSQGINVSGGFSFQF